MLLAVDISRCTGCGSCLEACPVDGAMALVGGVASVERARCRGCGACVDACPNGALSLKAESLPAAYPSLAPSGQVERNSARVALAKRVASIASIASVASGVVPIALDLALGAVDRWLARRSDTGYHIAQREAGSPCQGRGPRRGRRRGGRC